MKIGFLDSGIGGLSVLQYALESLPNEQFIYYADSEHVPYGEKTKEEIMVYVNQSVEFMIKKGVKAIVLACNTATSVAVTKLRETYSIPIISMEPAVKKAIDLYGDKRVFVTATPITVNADRIKYLIEKIDKQNLVELIALPKLVRFAEEGIFDSKEIIDYIAGEFKGYNFCEYSSIVLGCTHFNYFKDSFRQVLPKTIKFVDGIEGTVRQLTKVLNEMGEREKNVQSIDYYISGKEVSADYLEHIEALLKRLDLMRNIV